MPVKEMHGDRTVWDGVVEVFALDGHPQRVKHAYCWRYENDAGNDVDVVVLEVPPVQSPEDAVRIAVVAEMKKEMDRTNG